MNSLVNNLYSFQQIAGTTNQIDEIHKIFDADKKKENLDGEMVIVKG